MKTLLNITIYTAILSMIAVYIVVTVEKNTTKQRKTIEKTVRDWSFEHVYAIGYNDCLIQNDSIINLITEEDE